MRIPRPRRRLRNYATAFFLGAAVLLVAGWSALPILVERRLLEELRAAGVAVASLNVAAVGLHEARIEDVRLGSNGDVTAAEIIASYDFAHFLQAQPERLVLRNLRVSARLDSGGLSFGSLRLANGSGGGKVLGAALLRAVPMVAIESGRIDLATPSGSLAVPIQGTMSPRPDGSLEAAIDLQAQSAHGRLTGALKLVAADGRIDADLTIADGTATIGQTLSTAFTGRTTVTWVETARPQVSAALELKGTGVAETAFPAGTLAIEIADAQWTAQLALTGRDRSSDLLTTLVVSDPYDKPRVSATGNLTAAAGAWLWSVLGLPQPRQGSAQVGFRLEGPLPDGGLLDRSIATPGDLIGLLADGDVGGAVDITISNIVFPDIVTVESATGRADIRASDGTISIERSSELRASGTVAPAQIHSLDLAENLAGPLTGPLNASLALHQPLRLVASNGKTTAVGDLRVSLASAFGATLDLQIQGQALLSDDLAISEFAAANGLAVLSGIALPAVGRSRFEIGGSVAGKPDAFDGRLHATGTVADLTMGGLTAASLDVNLDATIAGTGDKLVVRLVDTGAAVAQRVSGVVLAGNLKEIAIPLVQSEGPLITIDLNGRAAPRAAYDLRLGAVTAKAPLLLGGPKPLPAAENRAGGARLASRSGSCVRLFARKHANPPTAKRSLE